jgi:hypothetical protein
MANIGYSWVLQNKTGMDLLSNCTIMAWDQMERTGYAGCSGCRILCGNDEEGAPLRDSTDAFLDRNLAIALLQLKKRENKIYENNIDNTL